MARYGTKKILDEMSGLLELMGDWGARENSTIGRRYQELEKKLLDILSKKSKKF